MHVKRVAVVSDDPHFGTWVESAIGTLDVLVSFYPAAELGTCFLNDSGDLVIVDGGRSPNDVVDLAESAAAIGAGIRMLLVLDHEALGGLRMPIRCLTDFVVRQALPIELAARVRILLWPGEEVAINEIIRVDGLTLNLATYQIHVHGDPVEFAYLEYALFSFLVTHPNRVYSREILLSRVWGTDYFGGARTVDIHIRRIRAKLGPEFSGRLETVRSVGYLWRM